MAERRLGEPLGWAVKKGPGENDGNEDEDQDENGGEESEDEEIWGKMGEEMGEEREKEMVEDIVLEPVSSSLLLPLSSYVDAGEVTQGLIVEVIENEIKAEPASSPLVGPIISSEGESGDEGRGRRSGHRG